MQSIVRWIVIAVAVLVGTLSVTLIAWHVRDATPAAAETAAATGTFDAEHPLVLADGDMAATAYADGVLHPIENASDQLIVLSNLESNPDAVEPTKISAPASNIVMGWPGSTTASADGRFAYVVGSRNSVDRSIEQVESVWTGFPVGHTLTTIAVDSGDVLAETELCRKPMSVDRSPDGGWLLIACRDGTNELAVVTLAEGVPTDVRALDLDVPSYNLRNNADGATYAVVHPGGDAAGVILDDRAVTLVRFEMDAAGIPTAATSEPPQATGRWLSVARWTKAGNHLLVADVGWGPAPADSILNGPGAIVSFALAPDSEERGEISEAIVSKSPEAFEMNRDGTLLAVVNMERTYLPGGLFGLIPGRSASSLSLVGVDDATGLLTTHGEPVGFRGVLPEDAVFDADGDQIAVVIYQDYDAPRSDGWITFFNVDTTGATPVAQPTNRRIPLPRGAHDLYVID